MYDIRCAHSVIYGIVVSITLFSLLLVVLPHRIRFAYGNVVNSYEWIVMYEPYMERQ